LSDSPDPPVDNVRASQQDTDVGKQALGRAARKPAGQTGSKQSNKVVGSQQSSNSDSKTVGKRRAAKQPSRKRATSAKLKQMLEGIVLSQPAGAGDEATPNSGDQQDGEVEDGDVNDADVVTEGDNAITNDGVDNGVDDGVDNGANGAEGAKGADHATNDGASTAIENDLVAADAVLARRLSETGVFQRRGTRNRKRTDRYSAYKDQAGSELLLDGAFLESLQAYCVFASEQATFSQVGLERRG
jgi:hypothetical protein